MKDSSFALAMNKIVGQAEAETEAQRKHEARARQRAKIFRIARLLFAVAFMGALCTFAVTHRQKLENFFTPKPAATTTPTGTATAAIKKAQQNAVARDSILNSIEK